MLTATGKPAYKQDYGPLPAGFLDEPVPFNDLDAVKKATNETTCAIMVEPVQGEGGVNPATKEYLQGLRDWCDENNLVLIFDEVQTGVGRLGTLWGYELYGVAPDVMTLAKGLGGGIPIGAILCTEKVNIFTYGDHGSTFGGNPLATAVALAVVRETIKSDLPGHVKKVGDYLMGKLNGLRAERPYITDVRGFGLLIGIEFDSDIAGDIASKLLEEGVLINTPAANVVRFMPPLILTEAEADEGVAILDQAFGDVEAGRVSDEALGEYAGW
jgi:acetylornithine/succinyldiaminopimelate/putrescine aminotransferase